MFGSAICQRSLKLIALTTLATGLTAAQALTPAGARRPASVPADYVITPFGYFHPSCVHQLANGESVRKDANAIQHADGSLEGLQPCAHAQFNAKGDLTAQNGVPVKTPVNQPSIGHAWIEYSGVTTSTSFGELVAEWTVPPNPSVNSGQTVYLFPGMEDYADVVSIIQPVLGWNSDYASAWGIASWNCCVSGHVFEATPHKVNPGDTIYGAMWDTCAAGTLSCPTWDILTEDLSTGVWSEMLNTSSYGQTFNWAFAGALEVYNIAVCGNYPPSSSTSFHNLYLYNDAFSLIASPNWSVSNVSGGLTPQCGYGGNMQQQVTLTY
jgi:hypothetical protein